MAGVGTFRVVDEQNTATVLFDLNSAEAGAAANPGGLATVTREVRLRTPESEFARFQSPGTPMGSTVFDEDPLTPWDFRLAIISQATVGNLREGIGELSRLLRRGCVFEVLLTGDTDTLFIDNEPTGAIPLLGEEVEDTFRLIGSGQYPEGLLIQCLRQPYLRLGELLASVNKLLNATLAADQDANGRPDSFTWDSTLNITAESINAANECAQFDVATAAARNLQQGSVAAAVGQVWAGSFYAASPGATAKCQVVVEFLDGASAVIGSTPGILTTLTSVFQRLTVISAAAPAGTATVRISLRVDNDDATARTIRWRDAQLEQGSAVTRFRVGEQLVSMNPVDAVAGRLGRVIPIFVQGNASSPLRIKVKGDAGAAIERVLFALRSNDGIVGHRSITDLLNTRKVMQCEGGTLSNNTVAVNDANGSPTAGNNVVEIQFDLGSAPTAMKKRMRFPLTTLLGSLRGEFDLYCRLRVTAAGKFTLRGYWAASSTIDPPTEAFASVIHDVPVPIAVAGFVEIKLGRIKIPEESEVSLAGMVLEIHAERTSSAGRLRCDHVTFVPAGESIGSVIIPEGASGDSWLGKQLLGGTTAGFTPAGYGSGVVSGNDYVLSNLDACVTDPVTGFAWPAGRHIVRFTITAAPVGAGDSLQGRVAIWNVDDLIMTRYIDIASSGTQVLTVKADTVTPKFYLPQVRNDGVGVDITVHQIEHFFQPLVKENEKIRTDPYRLALEKLDTNDAIVMTDLNLDGDLPLWAPPGRSLLYVMPFDVPLVGYTEPESDMARVVTVTVDQSPRVWV